MIRLNVFVRVNETNREKAIEAAKELTACSLKEEGCIAYDTSAFCHVSQIMKTSRRVLLSKVS